MASVNKVIIVGNLGRDPEMRTFPNGDQVANVAIATTDKWKDKQTGDTKEHTEWHRVMFSNRLAEIAGQYLRKGSQVYVEGSLRTRKWTDPNGVERYSTEIRADSMQMLGSRQSNAAPTTSNDSGYGEAPPPATNYNNRSTSAPAQPVSAPVQAPPAKPSSGFDDIDDDIPF